MSWNQGRRTWRAGIIVCAVIAVAAGGLTAAWPGSHPSGRHPSGRHPSGRHPSGRHPSGRHPRGRQAEASRPHPAGGGLPTELPRVSCGSYAVHLINGITTVLYATPRPLSCFNAAARECRAASIAVVENGVDTGTSFVFVIEPGGAPCRVTELRQDYSADFGGSQGPVSSTPCRRTAVTASGVVLNCGGPDILVPAKVTVQSPAVMPW